jgi:hypothetical protein
LGATDRPLFRTDLVSRPIEEAGHRFIEVTDPDSGSSFRFYEVEYAIACAMDGERDLGGLSDWARIELGLETSPDELRTVIGTLENLGYLETGAPPVALPAPLDRPPPAGRALGAPAPFDLPAGRASAGPAPFDAGSPADGGGGARPFGDISPPLTPILPVSMDLSEHIPVRAADLKEAVRQSRAMHTVRSEGGIRPPSDDERFEDDRTPAPMRPGGRLPAAAAADLGDRRPSTAGASSGSPRRRPWFCPRSRPSSAGRRRPTRPSRPGRVPAGRAGSAASPRATRPTRPRSAPSRRLRRSARAACSPISW